jgi:hypothetical protein
MVVFEWWILKVAVIVVDLLMMMVLMVEGSGGDGGLWRVKEKCDFGFVFFFFLSLLVLFSSQFFGPFIILPQSLIYSSNEVTMRQCECVCKSFQFHQLSEAIVWEICTMLSIFSNCLFSNLISLHQKAMP